MKIGDVVTSNHEFISEPDGKIISVNKGSEVRVLLSELSIESYHFYKILIGYLKTLNT